MTAQKGREFLLKIGSGTGSPETFASIGAARTKTLTMNNNPVDVTATDSAGIQEMLADAGIQTLTIACDGIFKDSASEELLRAQAFGRTAKNYELDFPNGDKYAGEFVVQDYVRGGPHDSAETFSVTLVRSGAGTFTAGT